MKRGGGGGQEEEESLEGKRRQDLNSVNICMGKQRNEPRPTLLILLLEKNKTSYGLTVSIGMLT